MLTWLFEPGFFSNSEVQMALGIGSAVALVSAVVGVLTVLRGQSFAGHALTESAATGGSGLLLAGVNPFLGFVAGAVAGAGAVELIGVHDPRRRDLATGIVLGLSIGLASLFLYLETTVSATTGATQQILFGSIFAVTSSTIPVVAGFGAGALTIVAALYRPLVLSSVSGDLAAAKGVRIRLVGLGQMLALALAVGLSSIAIGAILSTALLIGPAAAALRFTRRLSLVMIWSAAIGVGTTSLGILLAYYSADWSGGNGLPVSFFIVALVFVVYTGSGLAGRRERSGSRTARPPATVQEAAALPGTPAAAGTLAAGPRTSGRRRQGR